MNEKRLINALSIIIILSVAVHYMIFSESKPPQTCILDISIKAQEDNNFCGPAVAQSMLMFNGIEMSQKEIAEKLIRRGTTNISEMISFFEEVGFEVDYLRLSAYDDPMGYIQDVVCRQGTPLIVLQRRFKDEDTLGHYRMIIGLEGDHILMSDPSRGLMNVSKEDFIRLWRANKQTIYDNISLFVRR